MFVTLGGGGGLVVALPLSMQNVCILYKHNTNALTRLIDMVALKGDFNKLHQFVNTPKAHSILMHNWE